MRHTRVLFPILLAATAAAQPGPRQDCAGCHRAQALTQPATSMGRALETGAECEILRANPSLVLQKGAYSYRIVREGDRSQYSVTDGKETLATPILWAFGLGSAGQTYVYQLKGQWYESRVSFYKQLQGLDLTMGAAGAAPLNLEEAAGRLMNPKDAAECFNCHSTGAIHGGRVDADHLVAGVRCERCHGASERHVTAVKAGERRDAAMPHLGAMTTEETSDFCGQCHRTWSKIAMDGPHNVNNVRFQPYRLTNSKCYAVADKRISCVACHDPHREVERSAAFYDAKCQACHAAPHAKPCPVAASQCVSCHMPRYEIPGSHNLFSDHWIRVVKTGAPYPE